MQSTSVLLKQLEAHLQEEIGAQDRLFLVLSQHELALHGGRPPQNLHGAREFESEMAAAQVRGARRRALVSEVGRALSLPESKWTLESIVARGGELGLTTDRLGRQREDLRRSLAQVQRCARRCDRATKVQRALLAASLEALVGSRDARAHAEAGCLVDQEV